MPYLLRLLLTLSLFLAAARAHDGLDLPVPISEPEAWNAITLSRANIAKLTTEQQWPEIPIQVSICIQSARYLREKLGEDPAAEPLRGKLRAIEEGGIILTRSAIQGHPVKAPRDSASFATALREAAASYAPATVAATVYACPMCKGIRELDPATPCFKCGMRLVPRFIPASSVYNTPGEASISLTPTLDRPLAAGQPSAVTLRLARKKDSAPVTPDDLLVVHTERIHLLIIDSSLTDYHHIHPLPAATPGDYTFTFTPQKPGAYRIFADVVPVLSSVQEYVVCDLPATAPGEPITDRASTTVSDVGTVRFALKWDTGGLPVRARQPVGGSIAVAHAADGRPFTQLEPIMGTYAHLVGFHEDRVTVLHIHPTGLEPQRPEDRGGPAFTFRFYAPKAGFYRFYVQTQIGGQSVFAPFGLTVAP